ncbi:MAG: hypothetical protein IJU52_07590 [Clostridia bacterium]|nr:hypothetical protein [Clostridia bacterium]
MKLLSAEIAGFGTLKNYKYVFTEGPNYIYEKNGKGKTTFAAFLLAMLYGMDSTRANDREMKERARYAPWDGGTFGGTLTLSAGGRILRIERTFDRSSATRDELNVYDVTDGAQRIELFPSPGDALFGIPKDAFLRTAFLSGKDSGSPEGIMKKLNRVLNGGEEIDEELFSSADGILQKARKVYKFERGRGGMIDDLEARLSGTETALRRAESSARLADRFTEELKEAKARLKSAEDTAERWNAEAEARFAVRTHEDLVHKEASARLLYEEYVGGAHGALLSPDAADACEELLLRARFFEDRAAGDLLEEGEKSELKRLSGAFSKDLPTDEEIFSARSDEADLEKEEKERARLSELLSSEEHKIHEALFTQGCPTEEDLARIDRLYGEYGAVCGEKEAYERAAAEETLRRANQKRRPRFTRAIAVAAAVFLVCLACGILFAVFGLPLSWLWFILSGLSLLYIAVSVVKDLKKKEDGIPPFPREKEERLDEARRQLHDLLSACGYFGDDYDTQIRILKEDRIRYSVNSERFAQASAEEKRLNALIAQRKERIESLKKRFPAYVSEDGALLYNYLREDLSKYRAILHKQSEAKKNAEKDRESAQKARKDCMTILISAGAASPEDDPEAVLAKKKKLSESKAGSYQAYLLAKKAREEFEAANPCCLAAREDRVTEEQKAESDRALPLLRERITRLEQSVKECEEQAQTAEALRAETENLKEELAKRNKEYEILTRTRGYLETAERRLLGKYAEPLVHNYRAFAEMLDESLAADAHLSIRDLSLSFERDGALRSAEYFSTGFSALSDVCVRLALIRTAFPDERPFLVLDDPFMSLDDEHLRASLDALTDLSREAQILYFTCHSDRLPK